MNDRFASFRRVFPTGQLFRGISLRTQIWSVINAGLLATFLVVIFLLLSVLENRGTLALPAIEESAAFAERAGIRVKEGNESTIVLQNEGILSAAWYARHQFWGAGILFLYNQFQSLQSNGLSLLVLLVSAITLGIVRALLQSRIQGSSNRVGMETAARLRRGIHRQNLRMGLSDLENQSSERALTLFTRDCDQIREGVSAFVRRALPNILELTVLVVLALLLHWRVAAQCLFPLGFFLFLIDREKRRLENSRTIAEERADRELNQLAAGLRKTRLVRGYAMDDLENDQFARHLTRLRGAVVAFKRSERWMRWTSGVLMIVCGAIVAYLLGAKILLPMTNPASLSLAAAITMVVIFAMMLKPVSRLAELPETLEKTSVSAASVYRYLDSIPEVGQAVGAKFLQPTSRSIQFESVGYNRSNRSPLLQNLDLKIDAGEIVALVSLDPAEARALAWMLPRFIEPASGRVLVDGEDIAWVTLESLRAEMIYVSGQDSCFSGTVLDNITCGQTEYSAQDATEAARETHAHKFVLNLPQGYETMIGELGETLNTGQEFRISLARAVLRKPAVMIVEEPDQSLDAATKKLLDDAYSRITRDRTVIFLPTRLSTVRKADRVVLIHEGRVEAIGNHDALVRSSTVYRHWEYVRFNEFAKNDQAADPAAVTAAN